MALRRRKRIPSPKCGHFGNFLLSSEKGCEDQTAFERGFIGGPKEEEEEEPYSRDV